jgi:CheY-like chemotaxis protein
MGIKGQLEDLPLLDMIQIMAFSQKTGHLHVVSPFGPGAVVFKDGKVVCSFSWSTLEYLRQIDKEQADAGVAILEELTKVSVRELTSLREGSFHIEVTKDIADEVDGVHIAGMVLKDGLDTQHLLLTLSKEQDEERRETTDTLDGIPTGTWTRQIGSLPEEEPPAEPTHLPPSPSQETSKEQTVPPQGARSSVVVVDDEPVVADGLCEELESIGFRASAATCPAEGAALALERVKEGTNLILVADLKMPTSNGRSFYGGFELVRRLNHAGLKPPVLLMAETITPKARKRARDLGIRHVALKPGITKLDPEQYRADLRSLAEVVCRHVEKMSSETSPELPQACAKDRPDSEGSPVLSYLTSITKEFVNPHRSVDVSRVLLQAAAKHLERGILFLVKGDKACGLSGFGLGTNDEESITLARKLQVDVSGAPFISEVVVTRKTLRMSSQLSCLETPLYARNSRGPVNESVLIPMLNNGKVLTVLYGDNAKSGRPLGDLMLLELLMAQAGMAMENAFLQQRLRSMESKLPVREAPDR